MPKIIKPIVIAFSVIVLIFVATIPWRRYVFNKNISAGDILLSEENFTDAYVKYQKAGLLQIDSKKATERQKLAKDSAKDFSILKGFLAYNKFDDVKKNVDSADSKVCNLQTDRALIDKNLAALAIINLKFCANAGPKDYQSWVFLGLANLKLANNDQMFFELKPSFRQLAAEDFEKAYYFNPINKEALNYLISTEKAIGDRDKVDYWQKILDNLNKISK